MKTYVEETKKAVFEAIKLNHDKGLPVYQIQDGYIIAIYPNGKVIRLEKASLALESM